MKYEVVEISTRSLLLTDDLEVELAQLDEVILGELGQEVQAILDRLHLFYEKVNYFEWVALTVKLFNYLRLLHKN